MSDSAERLSEMIETQERRPELAVRRTLDDLLKKSMSAVV